MEKIVLAGGTGYLGQVLANYFKDKAKEIVIFSRREGRAKVGNIRVVQWDALSRGAWEQELEGAELLVNLCGKNVNCRYNEKNRAEIFRSRLVPTALLGDSIADLAHPPKCWINLASATIYRHAADRPQDEDAGQIGAGFSVDVCKAWEQCLWQTKPSRTRKVILRAGLVLGRTDGVFPRLKQLVTAGLGGYQGTGSQFVSWIHEQDFARIVEWICRNEAPAAVYNATAPEAVSNREFMAILRKSYGMPLGLPVPQWLLEIGAKLIGTETELVLKSRWVYPKHLLDEGFAFQFPGAEQAIQEILSART